ncbi:hypothetical protein [Paraliobacillus sp. JSM ZJ581]|uniref:hypothetical protein n=1 Tax=Paraliobacillus sp. JSM ZJ581 TaxID=3342118 RepID=UPI0035A88F87
MFKKHYIAITYDVCEHNNLYEDMNEYIINPSTNMYDQVKTFAKIDIAPLVKVYESSTKDFKELLLYKQFVFKEYECNCNQ